MSFEAVLICLQSTCNVYSTPVVSERYIEQLQELGYSKKDCVKALKVSNDNVDRAGDWLLDNAKVVKWKEENKITAIVVCIDICSVSMVVTRVFLLHVV